MPRTRPARRPTGQEDLAVGVLRDLDGSVRQPAGDLGEEPAVHEDRARFVDGRVDAGASGCLVVECGQRQTVVGRFDEHAGEDRLGVPLREQLHHERHGFAEYVAVDVELHGCSLDGEMGPLMLVPMSSRSGSVSAWIERSRISPLGVIGPGSH